MLSGEDVQLQPVINANENAKPEPGIGEISHRLLLENYAPAAVVINRRHEILYALGSTGRYLCQAAGQPTDSLLDLTSQDLRIRLRGAIQGAFRSKLPDSLPGGTILRAGNVLPYRIDILPLPHDEPLQMICFVSEPVPLTALNARGGQPATGAAMQEQELHTMKMELQAAIQDLRISNDEHRAINEETLTANEQQQAAIEHMLQRKTELEALSTEMASLNQQMRENLQLQQHLPVITRNGSTHADAMLMIDSAMRIRFFTPAVQAFFDLSTADIGRPLGELDQLASDRLLQEDCDNVLSQTQPLEREIALENQKPLRRRISPYTTKTGDVDGLFISFSDVVAAGSTLPEEKPVAFDATHELAGDAGRLRPLLLAVSQLQGSLNTNISGDAGKEFIRFIGQTAGALSATLNDLLAGNAIDGESGPKFGHAPSGNRPERRDDALKTSANQTIANLTPREREIMKMVVAGSPSKIIATNLHISQRTVENHRAAIMRKTQSRSLPALARVAFASGLSDIGEPPVPRS